MTALWRGRVGRHGNQRSHGTGYAFRLFEQVVDDFPVRGITTIAGSQ
jgi:hypothetical protein